MEQATLRDTTADLLFVEEEALSFEILEQLVEPSGGACRVNHDVDVLRHPGLAVSDRRQAAGQVESDLLRLQHARNALDRALERLNWEHEQVCSQSSCGFERRFRTCGARRST